MSETATEVVNTAAEVATVTSVGTKKKSMATGNLILDIAHDVETLDKPKALKEADKLAENVEVTYFRLGGVLKLINDNSWFDGYASFDAFVQEKYGFKGRKARYLIQIYDNLVSKQIPWEKVSHLGWTKLKELAPILTVENVDEWVTKAEALSITELLAVLNKGEGAADSTAPVSDGLVKMAFKFHQDQADIVTQAIAKARGELNTEFDTVAIESICSGYVGGNTVVAKPVSFEDQVKALGFEPALTIIAGLFPAYDINVAPATAKA